MSTWSNVPCHGDVEDTTVSSIQHCAAFQRREPDADLAKATDMHIQTLKLLYLRTIAVVQKDENKFLEHFLWKIQIFWGIQSAEYAVENMVWVRTLTL